MTNTIHIGEQPTTPRPSSRSRPLTYLPQKLDAAACLEILERIDPEFRAESISAARRTIDINALDSALEYTAFSISDKIRFKYALGQAGILSVGRQL